MVEYTGKIEQVINLSEVSAENIHGMRTYSVDCVRMNSEILL